MLDLLCKGLQVEQVLEANRRLVHYPIKPLFLFMMGLPGESPEEFAQSIALAARLTEENPNAAKSFNIYTPYPGTQLYELAVSQGLEPPRRLEDWARFNFRNIPRHAPWVVPQTRRLVEGLDFPLMSRKGHFVTPYKKTSRLVVALSRLYYPLAQYRLKHMDVRLPLESRLAKALGLFGRQD